VQRRGRGFFATAFMFMIFVFALIMLWGFLSYALATVRPNVVDPAVEAWPFLSTLFDRLDWQWVWIPVVAILGGAAYVIIRSQDDEGNYYRI